MITEEEQLLTQSQVAALKKMTLQLLAHHLARPGAPMPELHFGKKLYRKEDVKAWKPRRLKNRPAEGGVPGRQK